MSVAAWIAANKLVSAGMAVVVMGGAATAVAVVTSSPVGIAPPVSVAETDTNGSATVTWSAPESQGGVTGYRVSLYPTYTDRVPKPNLGPNGGLVQYVRPATGALTYTFTGLYEDCHQRYEMSVETMTSSGLSRPVFTSSFRPSGYVVPNQDPPYVVVLVDGIDSVQPGFTMNPYHPNTGPVSSYCPESWFAKNGVEQEADFAKPNGLASPGQPTGPWSFFHKWSHGETDANGNPTTGVAGGPNLLYASEPKNLSGNGGPGSFTHTFMLDEIAARGAVILPYSYPNHAQCQAARPTYAAVTGSGSDPTFSYPPYAKPDSDPFPFVNDWTGSPTCRNNITRDAQGLGLELNSIHATWPRSKLVVIGHSQGGLVAATAWQNNFSFSSGQPKIQAFSLDSPINGVCPDDLAISNQQICFGPPTYPDYTQRGTFDEGSGGYLGLDSQDGNNMHFIGTYGDSPAIPIPAGTIIKIGQYAGVISVLPGFNPFGDSGNYQALDNSIYLHSYGIGAATLEAQLPFWYSTTDPPGPGTVTSTDVENNCTVKAGNNGSWPAVDQHCPAPSPPDYISSCPVDFYTVAGWITDTGHFVVKYCDGVINFIDSKLGLSPVTTSSSGPSGSPSPSPSAGWACTAQTFVQALETPNGDEVQPAGDPRCLDGYAVMNFAPYQGGQQSPFFFVFAAGKWSLIEGGNAVPTKACTVIPKQVMSAWGFTCASPANSSSSPPSSATTPGHGSPAAAVAGLYGAELAGDWSTATGACSYVEPDVQGICASGTGGYGAASGNFQIHATVTQGSQALVEVTGSLSAPGSPPVSNSDPASGMPGSSADFGTVYNDLVGSPATIMSPVPCVEIAGQWYAAIS